MVNIIDKVCKKNLLSGFFFQGNDLKMSMRILFWDARVHLELGCANATRSRMHVTLPFYQIRKCM